MNDETAFSVADKFPGFPSPKENWSKLPHQLIEALPDFSSLAELKVVLYILRHTWGFQEFDDLKRITLDEFQHGRRRKDRSRLDDGVGMSKDAIREGIKRAVEHGFIIVAEDPRPRPGRPAHQYQLKVLEVSTLKSNKDQRLVLEVLEVSPSSEKDTIERNSKREKDTLLSSSEKPDPLSFDLERQTLENSEPNYATPAHAGGSDAAAEAALLALYHELDSEPPRQGTASWKDELGIMGQALRARSVTDPDVAREAGRRFGKANQETPQFANPHLSTFPAAFGMILGRVKKKAKEHSAPRHQPESALLSQEALRERQAARVPLPQDDAVGQSVKAELKAQMPRSRAFQQYIQPTRFACDDGALVITAPDEFTRNWLENRLAVTIERALAGVDDGPGEVRFEIVEEVLL